MPVGRVAHERSTMMISSRRQWFPLHRNIPMQMAGPHAAAVHVAMKSQVNIAVRSPSGVLSASRACGAEDPSRGTHETEGIR